MDLGKILEKKGLEAKESDNSCIKNYSDKQVVEWKGYRIPKTEHAVLEEFALLAGRSIEDYVTVDSAWSIMNGRIDGGDCSLKVWIEDDSIKGLTAAGYGIRGIPEKIEYLENMTHLSIPNNKYTSLPRSMHDLRKLQQVFLDGSGLDEESGMCIKHLSDKGVTVFTYN